MAMNLTDSAINKATREVVAAGKRRDLHDAGCPGLVIRLTPNGAKTFALSCRDRDSRRRKFVLGHYPQMGIADARGAARKLHVEVVNGLSDPVAEKRRRRAMGEDAKEGIGTLSALLDLYERQVCGDLKSWPESRKRIAVVFKALMLKPVAAMKLGDLQLAADSYPSSKSAAFAVRTLRPALKWAAHSGRAYAAEELTKLSAPGKIEARDRVLQPAELAKLLPALKSSSRPYGAAMLFMLLTLTRRQETALARWRDIDMDARTWTIPETKNGKPHIVKLSRQAFALLKSRRSLDSDGTPATPDADLIFSTRTGGALTKWDLETKAIQKTSGVKGWTRHDLRRTGATTLGKNGVAPHLIEAALNHTTIHTRLADVYNQSRYEAEVAEALQRLADILDGIEGVSEALVTE
jgi:integrase